MIKNFKAEFKISKNSEQQNMRQKSNQNLSTTRTYIVSNKHGTFSKHHASSKLSNEMYSSWVEELIIASTNINSVAIAKLSTKRQSIFYRIRKQQQSKFKFTEKILSTEQYSLFFFVFIWIYLHKVNKKQYTNMFENEYRVFSVSIIKKLFNNNPKHEFICRKSTKV